ncbi:MAG: peptide deformylase [Tabrizicola sp.]|nr:peptide deformylase [Tabrizicola sp.]
MPLLPILRWPDPILASRCAPVGEITDEVRALAADMFETMYAAPGRGLAAPQVGVPWRLFVMDVGWKEGAATPLVLIDPEVIWRSGVEVTGPEGCLSIPGIVAEVSRDEAVRLSWRGLDGGRQEAMLQGFAAICAQHEMDHLDGIVTLDRIGPEARAAAEAALA